jgi:hypothetical protein
MKDLTLSPSSPSSSPTVNSAFSSISPRVQLAWDSVSLGAAKFCWEYYRLTIIEGWQGRTENPHFRFGIEYHAALEFYDRLRSNGSDHDEALTATVKRTLRSTWNRELNRPWTTDIPEKNRATLVRTIVWYLEQFGRNDPVETIQLASGKPAVELSFRFGLGHESVTGEELMLCGHLDRLGRLNGSVWILDRKTTKGQIDDRYFSHFSPDNQMSLYHLAGGFIFHNEPIKGLIIDAAQVGAGFSRFQREFVRRTPPQLEEWLTDALWFIHQAGNFASQIPAGRSWPHNDKACYGCGMRSVCGSSPGLRDKLLAGNFTRRIWDPLQVRTDI